MRAIIQRAASGKVEVDGKVVGQLPSPGLVVLVGVTHDDTVEDAKKLAEKTFGLRILADEKSASDLAAPLLVVSQFTLYANTKKGRRPSWGKAAPATISEPLVSEYIAQLRNLGAHVETGIFGANMQVSLVNDGPVTIFIDTQTWC